MHESDAGNAPSIGSRDCPREIVSQLMNCNVGMRFNYDMEIIIEGFPPYSLTNQTVDCVHHAIIVLAEIVEGHEPVAC